MSRKKFRSSFASFLLGSNGVRAKIVGFAGFLHEHRLLGHPGVRARLPMESTPEVTYWKARLALRSSSGLARVLPLEGFRANRAFLPRFEGVS